MKILLPLVIFWKGSWEPLAVTDHSKNHCCMSHRHLEDLSKRKYSEIPYFYYLKGCVLNPIALNKLTQEKL